MDQLEELLEGVELNRTDLALRGGCPAPFFSPDLFPTDEGYTEGRICSSGCCLPCPLTQWVYPDYFDTMTAVADWIAVVSTICCIFLLLSWACLPVEKTNRHYLSICLTTAVIFMNMGFIIPLASKPTECINDITPHDMHSNHICGASGTFILFGGFAGVVWAFLRALSLHLQICWELVVGKYFHIFSQAAGWGVPTIAAVASLVFSGVSFRFGSTCHINHENSLAAFWIPLMVVSGLTAILQFATLGYCIKVYLASMLNSNRVTMVDSSLPSTGSGTITPHQAYRRVRRVIALQWRGITIVLIIIADVIFFSIVFVFQDVTVHRVREESHLASDWVNCLMRNKGDKDQCLDDAKILVVNEGTILAVLILLAMNGVWLLFFLARSTMWRGWIDLIKSFRSKKRVNNNDFVSTDARYDTKQDNRAYEMLSKDSSTVVTPIDAVKLPVISDEGRRTPDYFGQTARYHAPARSFSNPRPPRSSPAPTWDATATYARPDHFQNLDTIEDERSQRTPRI